jgi:hypothetical protein
MAWSSQTERETANEAERREWNDGVFGPSNRPTPRYLDTDAPDHYVKRLMDAARPLVSADLQKVETKDLYGSALKHYRQQYFDSARSEAINPTNIPAGELRQVTHRDEAGRPYYTFHGKASTWMKDFAHDKKKLIGIRTANEQGYRPGNIG